MTFVFLSLLWALLVKVRKKVNIHEGSLRDKLERENNVLLRDVES